MSNANPAAPQRNRPELGGGFSVPWDRRAQRRAPTPAAALIQVPSTAGEDLWKRFNPQPACRTVDLRNRLIVAKSTCSEITNGFLSRLACGAHGVCVRSSASRDNFENP